jgi:methylaspartate ammonia-lyase
MRIRRVHWVPGYSAYYSDDQAAIKAGATRDGFVYTGNPVTSGFRSVRQAGECLSVILELDNGAIAVGDCAAVQYSGIGGRDEVFLADDASTQVSPRLTGELLRRDASTFLESSRYFDVLELDGKRLHTALRYGISQALLNAAAGATGRLAVEVLADEFALPIVTAPIPLFAQSGDDRYAGADKMILKRVDALPHGLFNSIPDKLGSRGEGLADYLRWLVQRIALLRTDTSYSPDIHIDVYGLIGTIFEAKVTRIVEYLLELERIAGPHALFVEGVVDAGSKQGQIGLLGEIADGLRRRDSRVRLVADEWCNTKADVADFVAARCCDMIQIKTPDLGGIHNVVEAILECHEGGVFAYQGGTCNETDVSAKCCVHVALAARPVRMLVKPGMGVDEGLTVVRNEMYRTLALMAARAAGR